MPVAAPLAPHDPDAPPATRAVRTLLFGDLALAPAQFITFPDGLPGFADEREFALLEASRDGFWWLQSASDPALAFLLTDPFGVRADYEVELSDGDTRYLALTAPEDGLVLTIVTLPAAAGEPATTNLRAPVVINVAARRGRQVVRTDDRFGVQEPVPG